VAFDACKQISLKSASLVILHCKTARQGRALTHSHWTRTLLITVATQWATILACTLAAGLASGTTAMSLGAGGAAVAVPNTLLATLLWMRAKRVRALSAATFLAGEMAKLTCTILLLAMLSRELGAAMAWPALVAGVIVALKGQWLAVWFSRHA
jgi:F0F1-type ATP synthase assembly protein I